MTTSEMVAAFGLNYSSEINSNVPGFTNEEIIAFLNQAQEDIVLKLCEEKNYTYIEPLRTRTPSTAATSDAIITNMKKMSLTSYNFLYPIKAFAKLTRTDFPTITTPTFYECRDTSMFKDKIDRYIVSSYNKPIYERPIWFIDGQYLAVMADTYSTINSISLEYIARPTDLSTGDSNVHETIHPMIVDRAVELAIEVMANPRIQTHKMTAA